MYSTLAIKQFWNSSLLLQCAALCAHVMCNIFDIKCGRHVIRLTAQNQAPPTQYHVSHAEFHSFAAMPPKPAHYHNRCSGLLTQLCEQRPPLAVFRMQRFSFSCSSKHCNSSPRAATKIWMQHAHVLLWVGYAADGPGARPAHEANIGPSHIAAVCYQAGFTAAMRPQGMWKARGQRSAIVCSCFNLCTSGC